DDLLYQAVSEGRRFPGMEHWLPLFHPGLDTLFDSVPGSAIALEPLAEDAARERLATIADYYEARRQALTMDGNATPYQPLPPERLYMTDTEWHQRLHAGRPVRPARVPVPDRGRGHRSRARPTSG